MSKQRSWAGPVNDNIKITNDILKGAETGAKRDIVLLNTAAALVVGHIAKDMNDGILRARTAIESGAAYKKLEELIKLLIHRRNETCI